MNVQQIMTPRAFACGAEDTLQAAARIMWERDVGCVPVTSPDGVVIGMLTDRDICMAAFLQGRPLQELRVDSAMAAEVATCHPQDTLALVEQRMQERQVHRLPVVDRAGKLAGIVSFNDITRAAAGERSGRSVRAEDVVHTLAAISRPRLVPLGAAPKPVALLAAD